MMKKFFLFIALTGASIIQTFAITGVEVMQKSMDAIVALKSATFTFSAQERFEGGKIKKTDASFKLQVSPLKIYADVREPQAAQLIFIPSKSADVSVKKGIKLNLSPTNKLLIADSHQPVSRAGFAQTRRIILKSMEQRKGENLNTFCKLLGSVTYDGKDCYKIELLENDYKIVEYTVKAGETDIWKFCESRAIPEYKVKELNSCGNTLTVGQKIKIPNAYAKKTTLYIDKSNYLPIYQKMEDDKGLYELYEFKNLKINGTLSDSEFQFK